MAKTLIYIQEHGYASKDELDGALKAASEKAASSKKTLKETENRLKEVNQQIHYTGQYLSNKSVYSQFLRSKNKELFRKEHSAEITLYETALKILKEQSNNGKLPSLKLLKEEKELLIKEKNKQREAYHHDSKHQKELHTVCSNINTILNKPFTHSNDQYKNLDIS